MPILIRRDAGKVLAHSLDYDLITSGDSEQAALASLRDAVATYFAACEEMGVDDPARPAPPEYDREMEAADARLRYDAAADVLYLRLSDRTANRIEEREEIVVSARVPLFGLLRDRATIIALTILNASEQEYVPEALLMRLGQHAPPSAHD